MEEPTLLGLLSVSLLREGPVGSPDLPGDPAQGRFTASVLFVRDGQAKRSTLESAHFPAGDPARAELALRSLLSSVADAAMEDFYPTPTDG